jgi:photosystem II stability/assembly factor-like uncharacterized protein
MAMKKVSSISFLLVMISSAYGAWVSIGPFGGPLRCVAIAPSNEDIIYTTSYSFPALVYRSDNGSASWSEQGSISGYVYCLTVDPVDPDIAYAGGSMCVYKTTNGGATWSSYSISNGIIYGLVIHPGSPSTVCAAGQTLSGSYNVMAFFKSTNGGLNWSTLPLHATYNGSAYCVAVDNSNPGNIYVGGYYYNSGYFPKIYKSTNSGASFTDASSGISSSCMYIYSLAVHPTNSSIAYAGSYYGDIYRTTDSGGSWSCVNSGNFVSRIVTSQAEPNTAYAGTDTIIYKTTNSGATWFQGGTGYGGHYKYSRDLAASQTQGSVVYTADNVGIFKTTNSGTDWFDSNYGMTMASITNFALAPSSPSVIYTEFEGVGVFKTTDSGNDWSLLPTPLECGTICEFAVHNSNPDIVYGLEGIG